MSVADLQIKHLGLNEQAFTIRVKVDNPNAFALPIAGLNYGLNVMGIDVAAGQTSGGVRVQAKNSDFIDINLSTNLIKAVPDIAKALANNGGNLDYGFNGNVNLDNPLIKNVPFNKNGTLKLSLSDLLKLR